LSSKIKILHQDCDPTLADDTSLPQHAYLVEYLVEGLTKFDLVISSKKVDIFDHYWDNYKKDLNNIIQSKGTVSPKVWGGSPTPTKKKK
jgi:hypothetical protein|tara:strand:- start:288 stop:554 length:267 start_codon:yes stop_codon:yes gene_type:complete